MTFSPQDDFNSVFAEAPVEEAKEFARPWHLLVVDDEKDVHNVTKLALQGFEFEGRPLAIHSAYNGRDALELLKGRKDIAVVLLDVVMETEHAGLDVAQAIRADIGNRSTRVVLRTGQPGSAPEREVINKYDIHDYKEKGELTASKLYTVLCSALRSYRDIVALEENQQGLEQVISASADLFKERSLSKFTEGVLRQVSAIIDPDADAAFCLSEGFAAKSDEGRYEIVAGTGRFRDHVGEPATHFLDDQELKHLEQATEEGKPLFPPDRYMQWFDTGAAGKNLVYVSGIGSPKDSHKKLTEMFGRNVSVAYQNLSLNNLLEKSQRDLVYMLGEAVETRSNETGNHVKRVSLISSLLGKAIGMSDSDAEILRYASPLHDVGKIGVPDAILNKPGKLDEKEWEIMKSHAELGYNMLASSDGAMMQAAALVARDHHERWDGGGYPFGRGGEDISLFGRIVAVADVFDALGSRRCYKDPWPMKDILECIQDNSGAQFDPSVVEALMSKIDYVIAIRDRLPDQPLVH